MSKFSYGRNRKYRRSATNSSMSKPAVNRPAAPMQTSAISGEARSDLMISSTVGRYVCGSRTLNVFIGSRHQTLPLVEALKPFSEFPFNDAPLVTNFDSRQLFVFRHKQQSAPRYLQHVGGLPDSQKTRKIKVVFHRGS